MGPAEEIQKFDRMTLLGRRFFFRIIDVGNNEVLASSEAYNSRWGRDKTAARLGRSLGCRVVEGKPR